MITPDIKDLMRNMDSRYTLVVTAAKRARQITEGARPLTRFISDKPVTLAVHEIAEGKVDFYRGESKQYDRDIERKYRYDGIKNEGLIDDYVDYDDSSYGVYEGGNDMGAYGSDRVESFVPDRHNSYGSEDSDGVDDIDDADDIDEADDIDSLRGEYGGDLKHAPFSGADGGAEGHIIYDDGGDDDIEGGDDDDIEGEIRFGRDGDDEIDGGDSGEDGPDIEDE